MGPSCLVGSNNDSDRSLCVCLSVCAHAPGTDLRLLHTPEPWQEETRSTRLTLFGKVPVPAEQ